ncbi:hypothetical protein BJY01DRAFT_234665 [Aspergillus pseudoustus]|uniref:F-box domain-containing protein n=1 Tax=Aspergillus pseudoustus TaxID=1810923 RepID=A0ABR4K1G5_9EURO
MSLEKLPLEILTMVMLELDIHSLMSFGCANKRALQSVHAAVTLQAIASISTEAAGYLYLITCRRVCFDCFTQKASFLPLLYGYVVRKFALRPKHLERVPSMKSVPGCYSAGRFIVGRRLTLFDHDTTRDVPSALHGKGRSTARRPRTDGEADDELYNPRRFVAIVRAPSIVRAGSLEWGFHCTACYWTIPVPGLKMFTKESFKAHILECGVIVNREHVKLID